MSKVNFLVVGAQKAGTTAVHDHLIDMEDVFVPPSKEIHFFDDERLDWDRPDYSRYELLFNTEQLAGEVTPIYSFWPDALERIARYNEAMKIIFLCRDRIERAWSHWMMETNRNLETMSFSDAIRVGRRRLGDGRKSDAQRIYSYVERGFYVPQIRNILRLFGPRNLLLIQSSELKTDPGTSMGRIGQFLGINVSSKAILPRYSHIGHYHEFSLLESDRSYLELLYDEDSYEFTEICAQAFGSER